MSAAKLQTKPTAIFFDLDGTLIDSARDISESVSELVEERAQIRKRLVAHGRPGHSTLHRSARDGWTSSRSSSPRA